MEKIPTGIQKHALSPETAQYHCLRCFHDIHVHLIAAGPNALIAEYFQLDLDIMVFDAVVKEAFKPETAAVCSKFKS